MRNLKSIFVVKSNTGYALQAFDTKKVAEQFADEANKCWGFCKKPSDLRDIYGFNYVPSSNEIFFAHVQQVWLESCQ